MIDKTPSKTAGAAAVIRAVARRSNAAKKVMNDPYASYFAGGQMVPAFVFNHISLGSGAGKNWTKGMLALGFMFPLCRHRYFNDILLNSVDSDYNQVVILGAGYDTSSLRFKARLKNSSIFEVDFPATQERKLKIYSSKKIFLPSNVIYIPADLNKIGLMNVLEQNGFDKKQNTLFLAEGILSYLDRESIDSLLSEISRCSGTIKLVLDYRFKTINQADAGKIVKRWRTKFKKQGEKYVSFFTMKEAEELFREKQFTLTSNSNTADVWQKYAPEIPVPKELCNISAVIIGEKGLRVND